MPERPLLIFPTPERASRTKLDPRRGHVHFPAHAGQSSRLSPMFNTLQASFDARRLEIQAVSSGIDPEQVLVIETIGGIEKFANAVKLINGLEWLGELVEENIEPDADFYVLDEAGQRVEGKTLGGRLYFVMTNHAALAELLSLWRAYQANPDLVFRRGLARFREVFKHLKNIRTWGVQDRFEGTGVIEEWQRELAARDTEPVKFEIELWYRKSISHRQASTQQITTLVESLHGRIISQCDIEAICYHSFLVELPAAEIQSIITNRNVALVRCDDVMFFRPRGQISSGKDIGEVNVEFGVLPQIPQSSGSPVIALLDGLPLANHQLLANRLIVDDPDNFGAGYQAGEHFHGTGMASLIIHGDLNVPEAPMARPVYVRPVMKPIPTLHPPRREEMPSDILAVDIVHRAVKRIFDGDGELPAVAPSVRIINFSICDYHRQFLQTMSPMARLIDWLSEKYNVLFVLSAGNHPHPIDLGMPFRDFNRLTPEQREEIVVKKICAEMSRRKILSPAESINALTVGASHSDLAQIPPSTRVDPYRSPTELPSPMSAFGSGYKRAIKPDLIFSGGRQYYAESFGANNELDVASGMVAPGNKIAAPGATPAQITGTAYCCGTSNATALITRNAGKFYDIVTSIFVDNAIPNGDNYISPLVKTMLVHGCSWGEAGERIFNVLGGGRSSKLATSNWIGYGLSDPSRLLECTAQRASLLGFGAISNEQADVYKLPLPAGLGSKLEWRKLTVTLGWISPIVPSSNRYRGASLWFDKVDAALVPNRQETQWQNTRRGTIQHEVYVGDVAVPIVDGESVLIKVNCREDGGKITSPIRYGLAVTLEVQEGIQIGIYDEIRAKINVPIETEI